MLVGDLLGFTPRVDTLFPSGSSLCCREVQESLPTKITNTVTQSLEADCQQNVNLPMLPTRLPSCLDLTSESLDLAFQLSQRDNSTVSDSNTTVSSMTSTTEPTAKIETVPLRPKTVRNRTKYKCTWEKCVMAFPSRSELACHVRTHTGERPFRCDVVGCGKAFAQQGGLVRHKKIHSGEKIHQCLVEGCGKLFSDSGHLARHEKSHTGEKPHKCGVCSSQFATTYHLVRHQRIHTGDRPYQCTFQGCEKAFAQCGGLKRHVRVHVGGEVLNRRGPFLCEDCGLFSPCMENLLLHQWGGCAPVDARSRRRSVLARNQTVEHEELPTYESLAAGIALNTKP